MAKNNNNNAKRSDCQKWIELCEGCYIFLFCFHVFGSTFFLFFSPLFFSFYFLQIGFFLKKIKRGWLVTFVDCSFVFFFIRFFFPSFLFIFCFFFCFFLLYFSFYSFFFFFFFFFIVICILIKIS